MAAVKSTPLSAIDVEVYSGKKGLMISNNNADQ